LSGVCSGVRSLGMRGVACLATTQPQRNCALESILTVRFLIDSTILPSNLQHNVWRLACHDGAVDWVRDLRRRTIWP
jgi:hypothetical protein